jgi:hypothetical protein
MKNLIFLTNVIFILNTIRIIKTKITELNPKNIISVEDSTYRNTDFHVAKRLLMSSCNSENCFPFQGICKGEKCVCLEGYLTIPIPNEPLSCNYQQKKVIYSLLLESFGLIGIGHIYCERYFNGLFKMIWFFINIFYGVQFVLAFMKENSDTNTAHYVKVFISLGCLSIPVIWHFIDLYNFSNGNYKDGNGVELLFY